MVERGFAQRFRIQNREGDSCGAGSLSETKGEVGPVDPRVPSS